MSESLLEEQRTTNARREELTQGDNIPLSDFNVSDGGLL